VPFGIGIPELIILLVVLLIVFGPKRLPEMGRSLGKGMREFKDSIAGKEDEEPIQTQPPAELPRATADEPAESQARERDVVS
jgi:sec-independent protein translocase protein TatA